MTKQIFSEFRQICEVNGIILFLPKLYQLWNLQQSNFSNTVIALGFDQCIIACGINCRQWNHKLPISDMWLLVASKSLNLVPPKKNAIENILCFWTPFENKNRFANIDGIISIPNLQWVLFGKRFKCVDIFDFVHGIYPIIIMVNQCDIKITIFWI